MISFVQIMEKRDTRNTIHVYPEFSTRGKDIMYKGGKFYAIYDDSTGLWSTNEDDIVDFVDRRLEAYADSKYTKVSEGNYAKDDTRVKVDFLHISGTKMLKSFREWANALAPNHNYHELDNDITTFEQKCELKDYRSKRLLYPIQEGSTDAYDLFMSTCYSPENREKLEWAIGAIFSGDSKRIQKFLVIYGKPGTGKSTFFNIVQMLLEGYWAVIDVDALVSRSNQFGTAALKDNPLLCIQHDGDLSKIEKNDLLNSIVSHEKIYINEKHKAQVPMKLNAMIMMGTNDIVNISDTKQGITRRMIDVYPTGEVLPSDVYSDVMESIPFELGAIAYHCIQVYKSIDKTKYIKYRPSEMIKKSNVYTTFVSERYWDLSDPINDPITARDLYKMFKDFMSDSGYTYVPTLGKFKETMLDFYEEFNERDRIDGRSLRSVYRGFKKDCLDDTMSCVNNNEKPVVAEVSNKFIFEKWKTVKEKNETLQNPLDKILANYPAQYSGEKGPPRKQWDRCTTTLKDLNTSREHWVKVPENLICIDFDIRGKDGAKDREANVKAIQKWPVTYAEFSKSGSGIHLYYFYDGDVSKLSSVYDNEIEVKVYKGNSALRRKLVECTLNAVAHISSGLPLKEETKMVKFEVLQNERALRTVILKNLNKEYHPATKPSIDFIFKVLDDAYKSGMHYDVSDLEPRIIAFANNSTNHSDYCLKLVNKMVFKSDEPDEYVDAEIKDLVFFDIEVFPNVFICCWKKQGESNIHKMFNPPARDIDKLFAYNLVGYNNRKYDNHILYARSMGYNNEGLYSLSQKLVSNDPKAQLTASFMEAYNLSYADVFDIATVKQSLKKWEIELGIRHLENSYPWDEPLPEDKWDEVADYCCNDVLATEAVWDHLKADVMAREILADLSGLTMNHTTRQHTTKIIFGDDKHPDLVYTDLSTLFPGYKFDKFGIDPSEYNGYDPNDKKTWHTGGKSVYLGEDPSEGGYVKFVPGIFYNVGLLDIESMHPHSAIALNIFGKYTARFKEIVDARLAIKHKDFDKAKGLLNGMLNKYLEDEAVASDLAQALKIVINSVYGYTSATFDNPFRDPRNVDNIVAKRGALFMILLRHVLQEKGIQVIHVKTDSIKIPNITQEIADFVKDFGRKYGYNFDWESTYEKMCLINGSTYIAKVKEGKHAGEWVAVAAQFQHPYVYKTLFTKEPIEFKDLCETKEVKTSMVLDFNEGIGDEHCYEYVGRIGSYVPVKPGCGGGVLLRDKGKVYDDAYAKWVENPYDSKGKPKQEPSKYASVTGADGYRWMDSEALKEMPEEKIKSMVDLTYFRKLVDDAKDAINEVGDFEEFMSDGEIDFPPSEESPY